MWKGIFDKLKEKGLNPYPPGKHEGPCDKPYCVVKENSQVPYHHSNQVGYSLVDIIIFVPLSSYIAVELYIKEIRTAMKKLTNLRKTGNETPVIPDDEKKAYTTSIEYQIIKKLEV